MGSEAEGFSNILLNVVSIVISATLPVIILYYFKTKERRDIEKEKEVKEAAERTAKELKEATERNAVGIKENNERIAKDLEKDNMFRNEKLAVDLKNNTAAIAADLKHATEVKYTELFEKMNTVMRTVDDIGKRVQEVSGHVDDITRRQGDMDKSMEQMIHNLHQKADMTNGNVANIRNDLLSLQEDIDDMNDKVNGGNTGSISERRIKQRKRDVRRSQIAADSQRQHS